MKKLVLQSIFIVGVVLNLVNCSKDSGGSNNNPAVVTNGVCTPGSVYTQQGCLPVGQCGQYGPDQGWNGTQCIGNGTGSVNNACGAGMVYSTQYGCLSQCGANSGWMNGQCLDVGYQNAGSQNCNGNYNGSYNSNNSCGNNRYNNNGYYDRYYQRPSVGAWYGFGIW